MSQELKIALVQSSLIWENPEQNRSIFTQKINSISSDVDLIILPEMFTTGFTMTPENVAKEEGQLTLQWMQKIAVNYKDFKICPLICYDLRFPVWARNTEDFDVLIYVANWPKPRITAWDTLLKARAIENMSYCIGVNRIGIDELGHQYSGHSAVYDVLGEQITYSENEEIVYATITRAHITSIRKKLKFIDDRDEFILKL